MRLTLFLSASLMVAGCASSSHQVGMEVAREHDTADSRTAVAVPSNPGLFRDVPLKPMTASQSAARMN